MAGLLLCAYVPGTAPLSRLRDDREADRANPPSTASLTAQNRKVTLGLKVNTVPISSKSRKLVLAASSIHGGGPHLLSESRGGPPGDVAPCLLPSGPVSLNSKCHGCLPPETLGQKSSHNSQVPRALTMKLPCPSRHPPCLQHRSVWPVSFLQRNPQLKT